MSEAARAVASAVARGGIGGLGRSAELVRPWERLRRMAWAGGIGGLARLAELVRRWDRV
ncbi:MAG: hypothetical protein LBC97_04595 [Bifidobacteriaceae bacterium]|nr:hypothetical protein [Bifidobacteriaceae bacterium]